MQYLQLFINAQLVDFYSDQEDIPLILQVNDFNDLQSLQGNITKVFKLPLTQRNRSILGFPDDITICDVSPYRQLKAKLIIGGIEVIQNGLLEILNTESGYVNVTIVSGSCGFLDLLGGNLADMGDSTSPWSGYGARVGLWRQYDHEFNVANVAGSQNNSAGWIYPLVQYGQLDPINFTTPINARNCRPAFFLHTALEILVASTGYRIDYDRSSLTSDPLYKKILIPFSNSDWLHSVDYTNTPDPVDAVKTYLGSDFQIYPENFPNGRFYNGTVTMAPNGKFNGTVYEADKIISGIATFSFNAYLSGTKTAQNGFLGIGSIPASAGHVYISVGNDPLNPGVVTDLASYDIMLDDSATSLGHGKYYEKFFGKTVSVNVELSVGMQLFVRYDVDNSLQSLFVLYAGSTFTFVPDTSKVLWHQTVQCEMIFPSISQIDLIKATLQMFCQILISDPNTGTVIFISLADIVANKPKARDWSDKLKDMGNEISYKLGNYSQFNRMRYQQDDSIPVNYMPLYWADDIIAIDDQTLNPTQPTGDLFQSPFAPSLNVPFIGGTTASIAPPANTENFAVGSQPRILIDHKVNILAANSGNPLNITFQDEDADHSDLVTEKVVINDVISCAYFYRPDAPILGPDSARHLAWKDMPGVGVNYGGQPPMLPGLRSSYYKEFQQILNQTKQVTGYFLLTPADVKDFDFSIPVYVRQYGGYFYIAKIDSWIQGVLTKVNLVRL